MDLAETTYVGPLGNTYNFTLSWFLQHAGSIPGMIMIMIMDFKLLSWVITYMR